MTTARVSRPNEVSINAVRYAIKGRVRSNLVSLYAPKIVIGDTSKDSLQRASVYSVSDWRGGIGIFQSDGITDLDRAWTSECQLRYKGHLVPPRLTTKTADSGAAGSFDVGIINDHDNAVFASFGTSLREYNNSADSWAASQTLAGDATDAINVRMEGTEYLVVAQSANGYDYYDGTTWVHDTKGAQFLTFWDDRLWGIDSTGQLWWSTTIGTETNDAQLPLPDSSVTRMFLGRSPSGDIIIYCATTRGLFAHDVDTTKLKETELSMPLHPDNGKGADRWRDATYFSAGLAVYKYTIGSVQAVQQLVGPDKDDGLPTSRRGIIRELHSSHTELLALIDATTAPDGLTTFQSAAPSNADVIAEDAGFSHIMGYDDRGWESKWTSGDNTKAITAGHVSNAYSEQRFWFGHNERVYWFQLPRDITNPTQVTDMTFELAAVHETPDFDGRGSTEADNVALRVQLQVDGMSATETVILSFALNGSNSFTTMTNTFSSDVNSSGEITSNGIIRYSFPSVAAPAGTEFRSIRFKYTFARGTDNTKRADVENLTLEWQKTIPPQQGFQVVLDMSEDMGGGIREELVDKLFVAIKTVPLVEFTYRDRDANDSGDSNPYNYYVRIDGVLGLENTGDDWDGLVTLNLVEV